MAKTTRGRVVYGRKPHLFTYKDVLRVVRTVEISDDPEKRIENIGWALAAAVAAISDMVRAIEHLVPEHRLFWATRSVLTILGEIYELASFIPGQGGELVQRLISSIGARLRR